VGVTIMNTNVGSVEIILEEPQNLS